MHRITMPLLRDLSSRSIWLCHGTTVTPAQADVSLAGIGLVVLSALLLSIGDLVRHAPGTGRGGGLHGHVLRAAHRPGVACRILASNGVVTYHLAVTGDLINERQRSFCRPERSLGHA
jgi:hypothetical protein